jgi:hypothetical protein
MSTAEKFNRIDKLLLNEHKFLVIFETKLMMQYGSLKIILHKNMMNVWQKSEKSFDIVKIRQYSISNHLALETCMQVFYSINVAAP